MEQGIDLLGRLARIGYNTLSSVHCHSSKECGGDGPSVLGIAYYSSLCVIEFGLTLSQQQMLTNLLVDICMTKST